MGTCCVLTWTGGTTKARPPRRSRAAAGVGFGARVHAAFRAASRAPVGAERAVRPCAAAPPGGGGQRPRRPPAGPFSPSSPPLTGHGRRGRPEAGTRSKTGGPACCLTGPATQGAEKWIRISKIYFFCFITCLTWHKQKAKVTSSFEGGFNKP